MDSISYSKASQQEQRIKKFVAEPDSVAGLVTVPNLVPTGETVSIPAGRTLVHPNLQLDGTLTVKGTLFIPSGGSVSTTEVDATVVKQNGNVVANDSEVVHKTGDTMTGNLVMASGTRIQGDFSNAILANRTLIQNSVLNGVTNLQVIPNGTNTLAGFIAFNNSDPTNSSFCQLRAEQAQVVLTSAMTGTGVYMPIIIQTGGVERLRIDTAGNVLVTGSGGLGYGTGSGGTVTQTTSKTTTVTLNKPTGTVTMSNSALASGTKTSFYLNNSLIGNNDIVVAYPSAGSAYINQYEVRTRSGSGVSEIIVSQTSGSTLSDAISINFVIIKGALS